MQNVYGVLDSNNVHRDISTSIITAKQYATKNGYTTVSIRYNCGYVAEAIVEKRNGRWELIKR